MRTQVQLKALVAGKSSKRSQDGTKEYYNVAIVQEGEAGSVSCTQDVFMAIEPMNQYFLGAEISDYQGKLSLKITAILQSPTNNKTSVEK